MTQEDKELLLIDLCARLPYGVRFPMKIWNDKEGKIVEKIAELDIYNKFGYAVGTVINGPVKEYVGEIVKPYLFPLESMTDEQKKYVTDRWGINENFDFEIDPDWGKYFVELNDALDFINWCYENHLDINGLIPKDLANDATGLNIY